MMCGFLLARAGVDVVVLEKHKDFFRDFRGDTVHPSTLRAHDELGLLEDFLKLPHQELQDLDVRDRGRPLIRWPISAVCRRLQIHRADAAMGFPEFPGGEGARLSRVST